MPGQQRREHPGRGGVQQDAEYLGAHRVRGEGRAGQPDRPQHRRPEQHEESHADQDERAREFTPSGDGRSRASRYGYATDSRHT
ncbi:hypothetical protein OHA63_26880 [Streptomyces anulatus]|uniref:hypothetical protein n=1 Tax=Streptomyces anulatus TaxID=1892 RepID=UPI002E345EC9|nr:hypothetical protein [Streptomyces anulatus]